jgi:hypothetical protein
VPGGGSGTAIAGTAVVSTPGMEASETPEPSGSPSPTPTSTATVVLPDVGTGIAGLVLIGPQCPVVREGEECPDRPLAATIEVYAGSRLVTTVTSGSDGVFSVALEPGTYRLVPLSPGGPVFASEETVDVLTGETTRVLISYDSGIR